MSNTIKIFVRDCEVMLRVGLYEAEKTKAQPVIVSVEIETDALQSYDDVQIDQLIDYEPVHRFISKTLPTQPHTVFLETIAQQIITFCFQDPRVQKVSVRLEKTQIFAEAKAGIELSRTR